MLKEGDYDMHSLAVNVLSSRVSLSQEAVDLLIALLGNEELRNANMCHTSTFIAIVFTSKRHHSPTRDVRKQE